MAVSDEDEDDDLKVYLSRLKGKREEVALETGSSGGNEDECYYSDEYSDEELPKKLLKPFEDGSDTSEDTDNLLQPFKNIASKESNPEPVPSLADTIPREDDFLIINQGGDSHRHRLSITSLQTKSPRRSSRHGTPRTNAISPLHRLMSVSDIEEKSSNSNPSPEESYEVDEESVVEDVFSIGDPDLSVESVQEYSADFTAESVSEVTPVQAKARISHCSKGIQTLSDTQPIEEAVQSRAKWPYNSMNRTSSPAFMNFPVAVDSTPVLAAFDSVVKQQLQLARDFAKAQNGLHDSLSTAIGKIVLCSESQHMQRRLHQKKDRYRETMKRYRTSLAQIERVLDRH